jgi:hypothetical protein
MRLEQKQPEVDWLSHLNQKAQTKAAFFGQLEHPA